MEQKGIITGIGNEILPEVDATINHFIVGANTIIKGLEYNNGTLSAGVYQLCGYRGVLKESITGLQTTGQDRHIYAKFVINFDKEREDEFSIVTSDKRLDVSTPKNIDRAGTYYAYLYNTGTLIGYNYDYPANSHMSFVANVLDGSIEEGATTHTAEVDAHETQPYRVANTEYVHKQIVAEIDPEERTYVYEYNNASTYINKAEMTLVRRARLCVIKGQAIKTTTTYSSTIFHSNTEGRVLLFNVGRSKPSSRFNLGTMSCRHTVDITSTQVTATVYIETDGNVFIGEKNTFGAGRNVAIEQNNTNSNLGYEI